MIQSYRHKTNQRTLIVSLVGIFIAMSMTGCGMPERPADFLLVGFDSITVENVTLLPVLDHRIDKSKELKLDKWVKPIAEQSLKELKYSYRFETDRSLVSNISPDALEDPTPEFIASLRPQSDNWILLLVLEDATSEMTFGSTGNAEMSGYLFDKANRQVVWENKELGQIGQGGLLGMMMAGVMQQSAIEQATTHMFQTLPTRKRKK